MLQSHSEMLRTPSTWRTDQCSTPDVSSRNLSLLLRTQGTRITITRGQEVYAEGDAAGYCYTVVSGCIRLVKQMSDGRRQICEFLLSGDFLGFESQDERYFSAEAVTECTLVRYARADIDRLVVENRAFAREMQQMTADGLQNAYRRMVLLCHKSAQERLAWFLLEMAARAPKADCVQLPMTRSDIADYLGMVIETVSRTLTQMKEADVIAAQGTSKIIVRDRAALEDMRGDI